MSVFRHVTVSAAVLLALAAHGQLPQFAPNDYTDWVYNNPGIELTQDAIMSNSIVLYVNSQGMPLTLTSPPFVCTAGQTIDMQVTWFVQFWKHEDFVLDKAGFTAALINSRGVAVDSVTFTPVERKGTNKVNLSLNVSHSMNNARLRFASWKGDALSSGAVRQITMTSTLRADVNLDAEVSIADVNAVIDVIVGGNAEDDLLQRADVNGDGEVSIADINAIIDAILS